MTSSILSQFDIHIPVTPLLLFSLFFLLCALWIIFTIILRYHWKNYSVNQIEVLRMNVIYFTGSIIIILGLFGFTLLYFILP